MSIPMTSIDNSEPQAGTGAVSGGVRLLLRVEGLAVLAASALAYGQTDAGWPLFAILFLLPDLSFAGYLGGPRMGALAYNAAHSYVGPLLLGALSVAGAPHLLPLALVWSAHIGFDRMLGYGLKYGSGFGDTHLGRIGRRDG